MWRRFVAEHETLISIGIFGVLTMIADILSDVGRMGFAAIVRCVGIAALLLLIVCAILRQRKRTFFRAPLLFTTENDREQAQTLFKRFVESARLSTSIKAIERCTPVEKRDLFIMLQNSDIRNHRDPAVWNKAWQQLLREWEQEVDRRIRRTLASNESLCYHICVHLWLPLAFALGASVGLRRAIVLYHRQEDRFYRVLDLTSPRRLFETPDPQLPPPEKEPADFTALPEGERLALHLGITERHSFPEFQAYVHHSDVVNAALVYRQALDPKIDWLPYVQWLLKEALPLIGRYSQVDLCLAMPAPIAFALGMALSRTPKIKVCDYQSGQYEPVFSLETIEQRLPFD
mgnify:CR=1 FL=1